MFHYKIQFTCVKGATTYRTVVHEFSRWLMTSSMGFDRGPVQVIFLADKETQERVSIQVLWFYSFSFILQLLILHSSAFNAI
jgi:hypothetical protein